MENLRPDLKPNFVFEGEFVAVKFPQSISDEELTAIDNNACPDCPLSSLIGKRLQNGFVVKCGRASEMVDCGRTDIAFMNENHWPTNEDLKLIEGEALCNR